MTRENMGELLERDPFVSFRLVMSSGKSYDVTTPNSAMLLKNEVFVVFPDRERWAHVPFLHISSIEVLHNGRGHAVRRRRK